MADSAYDVEHRVILDGQLNQWERAIDCPENEEGHYQEQEDYQDAKK